MSERKTKLGIFDVIVFIFLSLSLLVCLLPILNTIAISFSDKTSAALGKVYFWPINLNLTSYEAILQETQFFRSFLNSLARVALGTSINLFFIITMAYPLSKSKTEFPAKNFYLWIIIFTMLFNGGIIPNFLLIKKLNLMDTIWSLVLPSAIQVFSVIILMNFFKGIPKSLEESALIDGASPLSILIRIHIPLAKASIATLLLFSVVNHWNSFFDGMIYINSPAKIPLQTYIQSLTATSSDFVNMTKEQILNQLKMSNLTFNSAKIVVSMIPILLIYPFLQRYFVTGLVMGAVKE